MRKINDDERIQDVVAELSKQDDVELKKTIAELRSQGSKNRKQGVIMFGNPAKKLEAIRIFNSGEAMTTVAQSLETILRKRKKAKEAPSGEAGI